MSWFNSVEILGKLIPIAQGLIVVLTVFTIWAFWQIGELEKEDKQTRSGEVTKALSESAALRKQNIELRNELADKMETGGVVQEKGPPRELRSQQIRMLKKTLANAPRHKIIIAFRTGDREALNYARELLSIFKSLRWSAETDDNYLGDTRGDVGLAITADEQARAATLVIEALQKSGIDVSEETLRPGNLLKVQPETIYLLVGSSKPAKAFSHN